MGGVIGLANGTDSAAASGAPSTPMGGASATGEPDTDSLYGGLQPRISAVQPTYDGHTPREYDAHGLHGGGGGGGSVTASGSSRTAKALQQLALSLNPNPAGVHSGEEGRGVYTLAGKPAAAHAAATLVNLAEVPANR